MTGSGFGIIVKNGAEIARGFTIAGKLSQRWGRSELGRGGKRVVREFKRQYLSGSPGINGGQFKKGKHVFSWVNFGDKADDVTVGLSRILRTHEEGAVIHPLHAPALVLSVKNGARGTGKVFAVVDEVRLPARTGFRVLIREMAPSIGEKVAAAHARAVAEAMRQTVKRVGGF